ncbi:MAG: aminopeptidase P family N-terminal domain-containing protein, partial [Alphaproteobacteria bacterium]|nr:aminopeptidase P family N-terminal domain-containing protein [Alphaproteobacteria bacterium]
ASRIAAACARMAEAGLDGLVLFRQESMYYLTGYDSDGWVMFQAMYLGADGRLGLLIRSADRVQSRITSIVEDIREWADREGASPADDLRDMLESYGCRGGRIGVEYHAYGLTAQRGRMVDAAFDGFCELVDASDLVRLLRLVKSPAELEFVRKAGALSDDADFTRKVADAEIALTSLEYLNLRYLAEEAAGRPLGPETSLLKIRGTEIRQQLTELTMEALGYYAVPFELEQLTDRWNEPPIGPEYAAPQTPQYLFSRAATIYGGSNEIQRNIVAKMVLGL